MGELHDRRTVVRSPHRSDAETSGSGLTPGVNVPIRDARRARHAGSSRGTFNLTADLVEDAMTIDYLRRVLIRDLETLRGEIRAYADETDLWALPPGAPNSAGTLALHLVGNLQHFIGATLGATGYVRDRDAEFGDRGISRTEIERRIDATIDAVQTAFDGLGPGDFDREFPQPVGGVSLSTGLFLTHLATHFAYHLGQLDYHRRMVTGDAAGVGAQSVKALAEAG